MAALLLYIAAILFSVGVIGRQLADECRQHGGTCSPHHSGCQHIFRSADCHHQHGHAHLCCVGQHPLTHPTIDVATAIRTQSIQYSNPTSLNAFTPSVSSELFPLAQCGTRVLGGHIIGRRIVGGSRSVPGEWPWQAYITYNDKYACSGAIIANTWLLTAAHCMQHADNAGGYMVRAGEYNTMAHDGTEQYYSIHSILLHPEFNKITGQNDIALIRINSQFAFNNNVRPICLPKSANSGTDCVVSGWGEAHGHKDIGYLKQAGVSIVPLAKCRTDYAGVDYTIFDNNICAGGGGNDACEDLRMINFHMAFHQGDSGGPLACVEQGMWHLTGVVSWGKQCGDSRFPGVYTRVSSYTQWIHNIIS